MPNSSSSNSAPETDALTQYLETTFGTDNPLNELVAQSSSTQKASTESSSESGSESDSSTEADTTMTSSSSLASADSTETIFLINEVGSPDQLFGSNEDEFIAGRFGDSVLFGNGGNDTLLGDLEGAGNDKLFAGQGNDEVLGNDGDDIVFGEEGDDSLFGGNGNDYLRGGAGNDFLFGGEGTDIFAVFSGDGKDTVFDFEASKDIIGLGGGLTFGQLTLSQVGKSTVISANGEELVAVLNTTADNFTEDTFLSV